MQISSKNIETSESDTLLNDILMLSQRLAGLDKILSKPDVGYPMHLQSLGSCSSEQELAAIENTLRASIPPELRTVLTSAPPINSARGADHIGFHFGNIGPAINKQIRIAGLGSVMSHHWDLNIDSDAIELLNSNYQCFGVWEVGDRASDYIFYSPMGVFDVVRFDLPRGDYSGTQSVWSLMEDGVSERAGNLRSLIALPLFSFVESQRNLTSYYLSRR
jgi:hypothetical protein